MGGQLRGLPVPEDQRAHLATAPSEWEDYLLLYEWEVLLPHQPDQEITERAVDPQYG